MNDNVNPEAVARLEELLRKQIVDAVTPINSGYQPRKSLTMKDDKKGIDIKMEKAGALIVGDNNNVTVQMGDAKVSGKSISAEDLLQIDKLVTDIATSRGVDALQIKKELADALKVPDMVFITDENVADALRLLNVWSAREIRDAVNNTH